MSGTYVSIQGELFDTRPVYRSLDGCYIMYATDDVQHYAQDLVERTPCSSTRLQTWWVGADDTTDVELDPI